MEKVTSSSRLKSVSDSDSRPGPRRRFIPRVLLQGIGILGGLFVLLLILRPSPGPGRGGHDIIMPQVRQIGEMMSSYASDHGGSYPDGNSSTEIFRKLIDEGYCTDPTIFYFSLPGKIKPIAGQKLKPENVCFDVTSGVDPDSSDFLPLVFTTGYKVAYVPGGHAVPIIKPYPSYEFKPRTWIQWWYQKPLSEHPPTIKVFYKSNDAISLFFQFAGNPDASIPNFVPAAFDAKGKTYRQLTPDGPLP